MYDVGIAILSVVYKLLMLDIGTFGSEDRASRGALISASVGMNIDIEILASPSL